MDIARSDSKILSETGKICNSKPAQPLDWFAVVTHKIPAGQVSCIAEEQMLWGIKNWSLQVVLGERKVKINTIFKNKQKKSLENSGKSLFCFAFWQIDFRILLRTKYLF